MGAGARNAAPCRTRQNRIGAAFITASLLTTLSLHQLDRAAEQPLLRLLPITKDLDRLTAGLRASRKHPRHPERRVSSRNERPTGARSEILILCRRRHLGRRDADFCYTTEVD